LSVAASPGAGPGGPLDGEATAEWLEVRVTPPGSEPAVARRTVFDRLPADVRHAGTPTVDAVEPITLVDLDGTGAADFPPMLGAEAFAIATGPTSAAPVIAGSDDGLGMFALAYHNLRDVLGAEIALDAGARTFTNGPYVVSASVDFDPDATAPDLHRHVRVGLDIWHRSHGFLPLTTPTIANAEPGLVAGVTDHLAERFALESLAAIPGAAQRTIGVGEVFEAASAQGIPTLVLHGTAPESLPYGPEARVSIDAAVAAGQVVVVPAEPVTLGGAERVGWWSIDPKSGETTDTMDDGSGSEFAEEGVIIRSRAGLVRCYGALAAVAAGHIMMATSALMAMNVLSTWRPGPGGTACLSI
jgi:hypothetical protein